MRASPTPPRIDPDRLPTLLARYHASREGIDRELRLLDARKGYLPWADLRHRLAPEGWAAEELWHALRVVRQWSSHPVPILRQKSGAPFLLNRTDPMLASLHRIDAQSALWEALAGFDLEERTSYRLMAEIEEAHHSSAIEGAVTTRRQSRELIRSGRPPRNRSERMVLNNFQAMQRMDAWVEQELCPALLLEMQATVTRDTLDDPADSGRLRDTDDVHVFDTATGEIAFVPPTSDQLPDRLDELCAFANGKGTGDVFLHPITRAILLHHQLAYDHPFYDGNGRTARTLFHWSAVRAGYGWFRALSISRAIHASRSSYYASFLHVQQDDGDVTYFVRSQLQALEQEIGRLAAFLEERARLEAWLTERRAITHNLNPRQLALIDHALTHPDATYESRAHAAFHGVTQPTAWKDLTRLVGQGLLSESRSGHRKIYRPSTRLQALAREASSGKRQGSSSRDWRNSPAGD